MAVAEGRVGEVIVGTGSVKEHRLGRFGELIANDNGLGRYFEAARLGRTFIVSTTAAGFSVANATFVAPLSATSTPIVSLFNPQGNGNAAVILKSIISILPVGPATTTLDPVWVAARPNAGITAASANVTFTSARLDAAAATTMTGFANTAVTGLVSSTVVALGPFGGTVNGTTGALTAPGIITDEVAGMIIVPPGGFIGVLATTAPAACTAAGCIWYAEVPWPLA